MFASSRPDFAAPALARRRPRRLRPPARQHRRAHAAPPTRRQDPAALTDATAAWAIVHGLADLMQTGRAGFLLSLPEAERTATLTAIIRRSLPG